MESKELETINNKYDIVVQPVTKEKKGLSFVDVVVTPLMVSSPIVVTGLVGAYLHPVLGVLVAPVAIFGSALWSGIQAVKAQHDTSKHHEELVEANKKKYSGKNLLVPVNSNVNRHSHLNSGFTNKLDYALSMINGYKPSSKNGYVADKPKIKLGKLFKSLFVKQKVVHVVERDEWAVSSVYKYRFMRLVEVEERAFLSPEVEWEKGFTLCVEIINNP